MIRRSAGRIFLALVAVFSLAYVPSVHAASGLSVGPFLQEVDLKDGQAQATFDVTLGNTSTYQLPMVISVVDFGAADDNGGVDFLSSQDQLQHKYGLASWMHPDKDNLVLAPHSAQQIKITIDNRADLGPGGHYGAVIFQLDKSRIDSAQTNIDFVKAVSTLVLAKKGDGGKAGLSYSGMSFDGTPFALPSSVNVKLYNTGNIHTTASGDVTITNTLGQVVSVDKLNPSNSIILPSSLRAYPVGVSNTPIQWIPGWGSVTIRYRVDDNSPYQTVSQRFYVISPWSIGAGILLIILIILCINYRLEIRNFYRKLRGQPLIERKEKSDDLPEK